MKSFLEIFRRQPSWAVIAEALLLVGLIGFVDYVAGWEWSLFIFYSLPIVLIVWRMDWQWGFLFAWLSAVAWWLAQLGDHPYQTHRGFALAVANRFFYFSILVVAAAAVKKQRARDLERIATIEHLRKLEQDVLGTCEREQQRLGRDLHDNLGPHLAAIGYAATFLRNELRERDQGGAAKAEGIRELVSDAMALTRNLAQEISPISMDGDGLSVALDHLARTISSVTALSVVFHETGYPRIGNAEDGLHLYRIAQEAVANAVKHGSAQNISILLNKNEDSLRLAVADDGKGMVLPAGSTHGMGIRSMRYRARSLGSELKIDCSDAEGTVVSCEMPNRPASSPA